MKKILSFLLATVMCLSLFGTVFAAEFNFTDVKTSDWFYNDVKSAVEMGLVNGKTPTTYAPNDNLTYAEAIKLAACMHQLYVDGEITLQSGNPWYKPYVDYCIDEEIIDKEYNYTENATRAGYMGIFANALPDDGLKAINNVPDDSIPDVPSSRSYAAGVYKLYRAGILTGVDEAHNCNPLANITRAEVAAILTRMMDETKRVEITDMGKEETKPEETKPEETKPEETKPEEVTDPEEKEPETTEPLAIKTQPVGANLKVGETAAVTVKVEGGKAPYTYQWYKIVTAAKTVTSKLEETEGTIEGVTTDTVKLTITSSGATYNVSCKITDADGNSVTSETVTIQFTAESSGGVKGKFENGDVEYKNEDFSMTIESMVVVQGRGIVLTGRVAEGKVNVGDTIYINDANGKYKATTKVLGIEMFKKLLNEAQKGDNIGLNIDLDVETWREKLQKGYVASATKGTTTGTRPSTGMTRPTTGSDTTEEEEENSTTSGGRVSIPTGKNEYME